MYTVIIDYIETAGHVSPVLLLFINARCIKSFLTWRVYPKSTNLLSKALLVNFISIFNIIHEKCGNAALVYCIQQNMDAMFNVSYVSITKTLQR